MSELDFVFFLVKSNKSAGLDSAPSENFKWLDSSNRQLVLTAANQRFADGDMPSHHLKTLVVSITKRGTPLSPPTIALYLSLSLSLSLSQPLGINLLLSW